MRLLPAFSKRDESRHSNCTTFTVGFLSRPGQILLAAYAADDMKRHLCASDMRSALRCVPDLSRKRDGRSVNADPIRISDALLDKRFSSTCGDGRKDKALTTMPSRLRDKSGHLRKAFLPDPLDEVVPSRRSFSCSDK